MEKRIKFILGSFAVLVVAAVAAWNVSVNLNSQKHNGLSDISLANVEALASEFGSVSVPCLNVSGTCRFDCLLADGTYVTCVLNVKHN
jgi:hypothetical protein